MVEPSNPQLFRTQEIQRIQRERSALENEVMQLRTFVQSLDALYEASDNFGSDSELMDFLRDMLANAMKLLNAPDGTLALLDDETDELVFVIVFGELAGSLTQHRMPKDKGVAGWVIRNRKTTLVHDVRRDPRFYNGVDEQFDFQTQSIVAAPLIGDGKVYGLVELLNRSGDQPFSNDDMSMLRLFCRAVGEALHNIAIQP